MATLTEEALRSNLIRSGVPEYMHGSYVRYLLHGIPPGDFMMAVLTNDLTEACARADRTNQQVLYQHVDFLYNYAPSDSWGSVNKVSVWLKRHAERMASGELAEIMNVLP